MIDAFVCENPQDYLNLLDREQDRSQRIFGSNTMPRLERLPQIARNRLRTFPAQVNDTTPFLPPEAPLAESRLAIVTTAGLHRRSDRPFGPREQTYRVIPSQTPVSEIVQSHTSIGFDRVPIIRDLNVTFPIDRVRELVSCGEVGSLARNCYSFMGALREVSRIQGESGPEVAECLRAEKVGVALITPT